MAKDCRSCKEVARLEEALATTEAAYRREKERADDWQGMHTTAAERAQKYQDAIFLTLAENGHLADGENCTMKALKDAVGIG